jgi:GDP-4-dehydro-6-deoxy-D-mannose reductase
MAAPSRILVTGARGFVGSHLVPMLRVAFPTAEIATPRIEHLDIADPAAVDAFILSMRPDACVHLAAVAAVGVARGDPDRAWRINLHGTLAVADALRRHVPECALIYPSSADAYGRSFLAGRPVDETVPLAPLNVYGATKAAADLALGEHAAGGMRVVVLRAFNHTGPGQSGDFVVPAFALQVARVASRQQPPVLEVGALDVMRDFLDVRDVCAAYVAALQRTETLRPGVILNISSGVARRVGDILDALLALADVRAEIRTSSALLRTVDIPLAVGDARAARAALNWEPRIAWETTLADVLADCRERVANAIAQGRGQAP